MVVAAASTLDNPSFVRSIYAQCVACFLHLVSSTLWVISLSSAYWSRGSYSFLLSRDAVHTVGVWKTCVTYIEYEPYSKTWNRRDGACWATSRYLFNRNIEISSILSFVSCMWIAVILALNGLLYTAKSWRPFIRQVALPGSKLLQMLVGLSMILVFSEETDVSYNVRLWARHLAMATIVLQAAEVLFLLCVGLSYKTWQRGVRDLCADISIYVTNCARDFPGEAHQPPPPRSTVIMNTSWRGDQDTPHLPPLPTPGGGGSILPPHEMREFVKPEVEIRALRWENTTRQCSEQPRGHQQDHVILDIEGNLAEDEEPVALYSSSGRRVGNYPKAFRSLFGRTQPTKRRLPEHPLTKTSTLTQCSLQDEHSSTSPPTEVDESLADLDQVIDALPIPCTQNFYNPRAEELSCRETSVTVSNSETVTDQDRTCSNSHTASSVSMKGRKLPPIPGSDFQPVPKKLSDSVSKHDKIRKPKEREVRVVEKDLRGMFKETSSRV